MFLNTIRNIPPYILLAIAGLIIGVNEAYSADDIVRFETGYIEATGTSVNIPIHRGINFWNTSAASLAILLGLFPKQSQRVEVGSISQPTQGSSSPKKFTILPTTAIATGKKQATKEQAFNIISAVYNSYKPHGFITCETGTGKTYLILGLMDYIYSQTQGAAEFYVSSIKRDSFLGLAGEKNGNIDRVVIMPKVDRDESMFIAGQKIIKQAEQVLFDLDQRELFAEQCKDSGEPEPEFPPICLILDEYPTVISMLLEAGYKETAEQIKAYVAAIARVGRQYNARVYVIGQGYQVNTMHIDTDLQQNFIHLILGRKYTDKGGVVIEACSIIKKAFGIAGKNPLFQKDTGLEHWKKFQQLMDQNMGKPIVWSDITNSSCVVPDLSGIDKKRLWGKSVNHISVDRTDVWEIEDQRQSTGVISHAA